MSDWRPVCDGVYEVSALGEIRRAKPGISTFVGRPVKPIASATGYAQVHLNQRRAYVHHIVLEAFVGPRPAGHVVNHKDGNKLNNALSNLEYVTPKENSAHAFALFGRKRGPSKPKPPLRGPQRGEEHWTSREPARIARGQRMPHAKLTEESVRAMRQLRADGRTVQSIADEFGISLGQTSRILRGERWSYVQ